MSHIFLVNLLKSTTVLQLSRIDIILFIINKLKLPTAHYICNKKIKTIFENTK